MEKHQRDPEDSANPGTVKYKVTTVAEEYKKNPELKQEDIRNLQEWVAKEAHLPEIPGLHIRMKTIHSINMSVLGEKIIGLMRPFMKKEMVNQMHFHTSDLEPMHAFIPKKILPQDYGGDDASMEELSYLTRAKLEANREWFMDMEKMKTDETKRKGRSDNTRALFGVKGSFKKLEID